MFIDAVLPETQASHRLVNLILLSPAGRYVKGLIVFSNDVLVMELN